MDVITEYGSSVIDPQGGGFLPIGMVLGGFIAFWIAIKAVKMVVKVIVFGVGLALLLAAAPWSGTAVESPVATCAADAVIEEASGWQTVLRRRATVESVSDDATCQSDGTGLQTGQAVVRLRTVFDIPYQDWQVAPGELTPNYEIPDRPA